ncbi:MAG: Ig-like domain-containing protein [archaeon]
MKKYISVIFFLILILIFFKVYLNYNHKDLDVNNRNFISSKAIYDTKATFDTTTISITVDANPPDVFIIHPQNTTYKSNLSIPLNYTVYDSISSTDAVWYNIDNGDNISLNGNTTFNVSIGSHTLRLFANDTYSYLNNSESVTFSINTTNNPPVLLQNIPNITWNEDTSTTLDLMEYFNDTDNDELVFNFTSVDNIDIEVSDGIATFTPDPNFYGTRNTSVTANDSSLSVTSNLFYLIVNDVAEPSSPSGPGGGGGGGISPVTDVNDIEFVVNPTNLEVSLKQGETKKTSIKIKNVGSETIYVNVDLNDLNGFISLPNNLNVQSFEIKPNEQKSIQIIFSVEENMNPDLYIKNIIIKSGSVEKIIKVIINVNSKEKGLDINLEIPDEFLSIEPGQDLMANIEIINIFDEDLINVDVTYIIKDMDNNVLFEEKEIISILKKIKFFKKITTPFDIKEGTYNFYVNAEYKDIIDGENLLFNVSKKEIEKPLREKGTTLTILIIVFVSISIFLLLFYIQFKRTIYIRNLNKRPRKR